MPSNVALIVPLLVMFTVSFVALNRMPSKPEIERPAPIVMLSIPANPNWTIQMALRPGELSRSVT
jgi:hypothetical protein